MGVAVYVPFLLSIGLSLGQVALVNTVCASALILSELPTGMLADGRSRIFSLKWGMGLYAISCCMYFAASTLWMAALAEGCIGIGMACLSGVQQAWIADALEREGKRDELRQVYANEMLIRTVIFLCGGFLGALIAQFELRLIWLPLILSKVVAICPVWVDKTFYHPEGPQMGVECHQAQLLPKVHLLSWPRQ